MLQKAWWKDSECSSHKEATTIWEIATFSLMTQCIETSQGSPLICMMLLCKFTINFKIKKVFTNSAVYFYGMLFVLGIKIIAWILIYYRAMVRMGFDKAEITTWLWNNQRKMARRIFPPKIGLNPLLLPQNSFKWRTEGALSQWPLGNLESEKK